MATSAQLREQIAAGRWDGPLAALYGTAPQELARQRARYCAALEQFELYFGPGRQVQVYSAPGRAELGGNHTDHQHGYGLAAAVTLDLVAVAARNTDGYVRVKSRGFNKLDVIDLATAEPQEGESTHSASLIRGIAEGFRAAGKAVGGFDAYTASDVLRGSGLSKQQIAEKVQRLLDLVGIGDKAEAYPKQLSGGQKQRVAIARALANDPNVLLCDEATSALDPQTTKAILQLLKHLNETLGITVVIITHEMAVVKEICHRVAVMEHGKVVESGEVFNIFANPREDITKSFIHTTSNLRKIEELIAEDSPVVKLNPGELIVRLSYIQRNVSEPLISTVSRKFDIVLNIIFSDIAIVQNAPIGGTVAIISGSRDQITQAIAYLSEKNVGVEVIKDARVSE